MTWRSGGIISSQSSRPPCSETVQPKLERVLSLMTKVARELSQLEQGELAGFRRKAEIKDESGWRGPAGAVQPFEKSSASPDAAATIKWQGRIWSVRAQDLRRALVHVLVIILLTWGLET